MPYRTIWEPVGIVWEFYGDVTAEEIQNANNEFYEDARSDKAKYQIIDALKVKSVEWNEIDISVVAAHDIGANHSIKDLNVAYVADDDEIISKLEKYIEISRRMETSWRFMGFKSLKDAKEWATS